MKRSIGIVGGAGPQAGLLLCQTVFDLLQQEYQCKADADFPMLTLISYPFAEMLAPSLPKAQKDLIRRQLEETLLRLERGGTELIAIACNTLHAFLPSTKVIKQAQLVSLIEEIEEYLLSQKIEKVLVLCTGTSTKNRVHTRICSCVYPDSGDQKVIDTIIEEVLRGEINSAQSTLLTEMITRIMGENPDIQATILGCTELSQIECRYPLETPMVIDPIKIIARKLCYLSFANKKVDLVT
ncbi:MAG: putative amino-acid racemase [Chlamydiae bacterium]|nr:putative amino-acid racemase [Chlamydiota bacterium]